MLFFKKLKKTNLKYERKEIALPMYSAAVPVDCFDNRVKQGVSDIAVGDVGFVRKKNPIIDSKHNDVAVYVNGVDCGFLPTIVGDCLCDVFPNEDYPCTVSSVSYGSTPVLSVDIMLPYVYGAKGLPLPVTLASESNSVYQNEIKNSEAHDYLSIKYNESTGKFDVYNLSIDTSLGVLSDVATPWIF